MSEPETTPEPETTAEAETTAEPEESVDPDAPTPAPTVEPPVHEGSDPETIIAFKNRMIQLGWMEAGGEVVGEYDQALADAVAALQTWLRDNWDEEKWGEPEKMPAVNGAFVDWKTMTIVYSSDNPPEKPEA